MGPFAFIPFMECYHGVLSLDHSIGGTLHWGEKAIDFHHGRGYTETDYGQAFPRAWVWMQSNHFSIPGTSLTLSVARIPWLEVAFRGFVIGFWNEGRLHRFTTYLGSRLRTLSATDQEVRLVVESRQECLRIRAIRSGKGLLHAPYRVTMERRVTESLTAQIEVELFRKKNGKEYLLFHGRGETPAWK
ncbi:MAG: tocopherol cyclase family protein [Coprothermobacterota bacterium]|nr:tocopherol cyclase family protein [Coprothermobacterota bacterium]